MQVGDTDGVDDDEPVLADSIGGDALEQFGVDDAGAAPLHLPIVAAGANVPHEQQALHGLDVRARRNHVDGDGDSRVERPTELLDEVLGLPPVER